MSSGTYEHCKFDFVACFLSCLLTVVWLILDIESKFIEKTHKKTDLEGCHEILLNKFLSVKQY